MTDHKLKLHHIHQTPDQFCAEMEAALRGTVIDRQVLQRCLQEYAEEGRFFEKSIDQICSCVEDKLIDVPVDFSRGRDGIGVHTSNCADKWILSTMNA